MSQYFPKPYEPFGRDISVKVDLSNYATQFPKPYEPFGRDINVTVDLSNYATKTDIKNISHADTSSFAVKSNLASLKLKLINQISIN